LKITKLLLFLFIGCLSLGVWGSVELREDVRLYTADLVGVILVIWGLLSLGAVRKRFILPQPLAFWSLSFLLVSLVSWLAGLGEVSPEEGVIGLFYWLRWGLYFCVWLVTVNALNQGLAKSHLVWAWLGASWLLALSGFGQLLMWPDLTVLDPSQGWDPHRGRLVSSLMDPNFTAAGLAMGLFLTLGFWPGKKGARLTLAVLALALLLTFSRSGWLFLTVGLFIWGLFRDRRWWIVALALFLAAYLFVPRVQTRLAGLTDPADSASYRFQSYKKTWTLAQEKPWLGFGFNLWRPAQRRAGYFTWDDPSGGHSGAGSDASLLLVLATTGWLGFLVYGGWWLSGVALGWRSLQKGFNRPALALLAVSGGWFVGSLFINALFYPLLLNYWWGWTALVATSDQT